MYHAPYSATIGHEMHRKTMTGEMKGKRHRSGRFQIKKNIRESYFTEMEGGVSPNCENIIRANAAVKKYRLYFSVKSTRVEQCKSN